MAHGVTPEPPPGSEHYREGWRDGYEQADHELHAWKVRAEYAERNYQQLARSLESLCPCDVDPDTGEPEQECPIHGDGVTFVEQIQALHNRVHQLRGLLRNSARKTVFFRQMWRLGNEKRVELRKELELYRKTATIGGPPPKVTPCWEPGDSSRPPTAPPEPEVVELPNECQGCVTATDVGVPEYEPHVVHRHPECPLHGDR